jgi:serine/threonine protein phosphatase PrpC
MLYVLEDIGGRPYQEDRHNVKIRLYQDYDYIAVFDGHGGDFVSEYLKFHLKDYVKKHLEAGKRPGRALFDAFIDAHGSLPHEGSYMTGSAVIVALRRGDEIWVANCGDSRGIMSGYRRVIALSQDHKPSREDEHARIVQLGGRVTFHPMDVPRVNGNLALSRSLGDKYLAPFVIPDPEIRHFKLNQHNRYLLLATDGLWDVISNQEVMKTVDSVLGTKKHVKQQLRDAANELLHVARERGSQDNFTVLIWVLA